MEQQQERIIRVGSRKSLLAQFQTKYVISRLQKLHPERKFEIHIMSTMGDRVLNVSLPKIGEKSLFTKDLEDALRNGGVDFVVHSLKDLPTSLPSGMAIGSILERGDPRDALILNEKHRGATLSTLPPGSIIGTSSLRRTAQIMRKYPHLVVNDVRGNLNTRLAKLDAPNSKFSGLILAAVGVERMGWKDRIDDVLESTDIMYAVGQGALAVECRANDDFILEMLEKITDYESVCEILAERSFLKTLGGGCSAPVAVHTILKSTNDSNEMEIEIRGGVWSLDGSKEITDSISTGLGVVRKRPLKSTTDDNESDGVLPPKQVKLDSSRNNNGTGDSDSSSDDSQVKRQSPIIIDETKIEFVEDDDKKPLDIKALINIHGDLFKNCPFSSQLKAMNGLLETGEGALKLSDFDHSRSSSGIGQEVMGECPVLNVQEKVEILNTEAPSVGGGGEPVAALNKCPITGNVAAAPNGDTNGTTEAKCPFSLKRRSSASTAIYPTMLEVNGVDSCPYMNSIKMIDCDENRNFIDTPSKVHSNTEAVATSSAAATESEDDSVKLYCGLICHKTLDEKVLESCEELGQKLAQKIIDKGGLEIMKVAQNTIHSKIGNQLGTN